MPLTAQCGHCFHVYNNIPDDAAGKSFKCKECGERVNVPRAGASVAPAPESLPPLPGNASPRSQPRSAKSRPATENSAAAKIGAVVVAGVVLVVGFVLKNPKLVGRGVKNAVNNSAEEPATEPQQTTVESGPLTASAIMEQSGVMQDTIEELEGRLASGKTETEQGTDLKLELVSLRIEHSELVMSSKEAPGGDTAVASDDMLLARRDAFSFLMRRQKKLQWFSQLLSAMTLDEYREFESVTTHMPKNLLPDRQLAAVPIGLSLNDRDWVMQRRDAVAEIFERDAITKFFAGPLRRMDYQAYRQFEFVFMEPNFDPDKLTSVFSSGPRTKVYPDGTTFGDNGIQFPADRHSQIVDAARKVFDAYVEGQKSKGDATMASAVAAPSARKSIQPRPEPLPFWAKLEVEQPAEQISWASELRKAAKLPADPKDYITSVPPSPFVIGGLTGFNKGQLRAFDLRTGKQTGALQVPIENGDLYLAPDGQHVVLEKTMPGTGQNYYVYSFESGQLVTTIESPTCHVCSWAAFVTPTEFVAFESRKAPEGDSRTVVLYEVATGEVIREFFYSGTTFDDMMAASPDGRYIAALDHGFAVKLYDLQEGKAIAEKQLDRESYLNIESLEFSHDGSKLAVVGRNSQEETTFVRIIDTDSGNLAADFTLPGQFSEYVETHSSYAGRDVCWFPDDTAILVGGGAVIDVERERELFRYSPVASNPFLIPNGLRVPIEGGISLVNGYGNGKGTITMLPLDFEQLRQWADADAETVALQYGSAVSLEIDLDEKDVPEDALALIEENLIAVAESRGMAVEEDADVILRIAPGRASARGASGSQNSAPIEVAWIVRDGGRLLWKATVSVSTLTAKKAAAGDEKAASIVGRVFSGGLFSQLQALPIPTMIAADGKSGLPVVGAGNTTSRRSR